MCLSEILKFKSSLYLPGDPLVGARVRAKGTAHCPLLDRCRTAGTEYRAPSPAPPHHHQSSRAHWSWTLSMSRNRGASRVQQYLSVSGLGFLVTALETVTSSHYTDQAGFELTESRQLSRQPCLSHKATGVAPMVLGALGCRRPLL